jgi:toxin HigB-1
LSIARTEIKKNNNFSYRINRAKDLNDLKIPPGSKLEQLSGDRQGQFSIRINDQYGICFFWENGIASFVEITDYH